MGEMILIIFGLYLLFQVIYGISPGFFKGIIKTGCMDF